MQLLSALYLSLFFRAVISGKFSKLEEHVRLVTNSALGEETPEFHTTDVELKVRTDGKLNVLLEAFGKQRSIILPSDEQFAKRFLAGAQKDVTFARFARHSAKIRHFRGENGAFTITPSHTFGVLNIDDAGAIYIRSMPKSLQSDNNHQHIVYKRSAKIPARKQVMKPRKKSIKRSKRVSEKLPSQVALKIGIYYDPSLISYLEDYSHYEEAEILAYFVQVLAEIGAKMSHHSLTPTLNAQFHFGEVLSEQHAEWIGTSRTLDVQRIRKRFCRFNKWTAESGSERWQHGMLLVGYEMGSSRKRIGRVLGLTYPRAYCRPRKSCSVLSMQHADLAHVAAHQLGHSLGMSHDESCADGSENTIMSNTLGAGTLWSTCSRQQLKAFLLDADLSWCLDEEEQDDNGLH